MERSATEVMQDIIVAAVLDAVAALKTASKGLPNTLLRDINAVHANTTFGDLPKEVQDAIGASVRAAFNRLQKEGYVVSDRKLAPPPGVQPRREGQGRRDGPPRPGGGRPTGNGPPRGRGPGSGLRPPPGNKTGPRR